MSEATPLPGFAVSGFWGTEFVKSSYSHLDDEVECVALGKTEDGLIVLADTKDPSKALTFTPGEITRLFEGAAAGEFAHLLS
ncbi:MULTISPECIES: DUF397 domain-containing protein [unclassified Streptomyces]|uniref:DUF397 domain-containing protein n=1 Tax=unclassified Streptomyces TaxID=2593676 RepID=UPI0022AF1E8F|nr:MULTISPECIES: DUF397 domain-containing protein [unclassified Streptomyces]MCZ4097291.1 DUF397 domain-containing protein [Streptomyces sp. H39-C1]MCZ4120595.1 DUF397 domain-containing protein [Streptomyces sp. H39-S7]